MLVNNIASVLFVAMAIFLFVLNAHAANAVAHVPAAAATIAPEPEEPGVCSNRMPERPGYLAGSIPDMAIRLHQIFRSEPGYEHGKDHFVKYLMDHFMHINVGLSGKCNGVQECEIIRSCDDMKLPNDMYNGTRTADSQHAAYVIMVQIQNIANFYHMLHRLFLDLAIEQQALTPTMISLFTHNAEVAMVTEHNRLAVEKAYHWERFGFNTFLGLAGILSMAAGPAGIPIMGVVFATEAGGGELLDQAYKHKNIGKRDIPKVSTQDWTTLRAQFPSGLAGDDAAKFIHRFGGLNATHDDIGDISKHLYSWLTLQDTGFQPVLAGNEITAADLDRMNTKVLTQAAKVPLTILDKLFSGENIGAPGGKVVNLATMIANGNFLEPVSRDVVHDFLQEQIIASDLNTIMSAEMMWVQMSRAFDGNCEMDVGTQGPSVNRVCLPEDPEHVYRAYTHSRIQESRNGHVASLETPAGWHLLAGEGWNRITQEHVIRSISLGYKQNENKPMHTNLFADSEIEFDPQSAFMWTPSRPGTFDVAVRFDKDNTYVSSLNDKKGRQYPCAAGDPSPFAPQEDLDAFHTEKAGAMRLAHFVDKTGLAKSPDFKEGCGAHSVKIWMSDRQRCAEGIFEMWQWYNRTSYDELDFNKHVRYNYVNCHLQPGSAMTVGKDQCERGNCKPPKTP